MNIGKLLAEAIARGDAHLENGQDSEDICMDLSKSRQILKDALVAWDKTNPFEVGDILKPAKHSSTFRATLGHVMVLRKFDREEVEVGDQFINILSFDMRILSIRDNGVVIEMQAHSRDFDLVERAQ